MIQFYIYIYIYKYYINVCYIIKLILIYQITHGDIFYRISGSVMKSMPSIETVEMERNKNNPEMDHQSKFGRKGDPSAFPNVFSMFGGDKRHYERSSSTKIPYPIYK